MANEQQTETANKRLKGPWTPPRGIRYTYSPDRPAPFILHWRNYEGARKAQSFASESAREKVAKALAEKVESHGKSILSIDPVRWRRYEEFQKLVGEDIDPVRVAQEWLQTTRNGPSRGITVSEAVAKYIELRKEANPHISPDTLRHWDKHLVKRFAGQFGARRLNDVSAEEIREWLRDLVSPRSGQLVEPITRRHHRKDVNSFYKRALREGWTKHNPCELVDVPSIATEDVSVIDPKDAFEFFKANRDQRVIGRIVLEAFGGLRFSTAGRITKELINFEEKGIAMPGAIHKSGKRKFRQGHPDVLWQWLARAPDATWSMSLLEYRREKKEAFIRARVPFLKNIWRHSFASFLIAQTKNLVTTGYLMQHRNTSTTEIYEGVATEANARKYFAITPDATLLTWEQFSESSGVKKS